jgi:phospholipid-binding lipoprotein MlaA
MNMLTIEFRDQTESNICKDLSISLALLTTLLCITLFWPPSSHASQTSDPLEPVNRVTMQFNKALDTAFLKPVASTYDNLMPGFAKHMIGNFFANLGEIPTAVNHTLQGRIDQAATDMTRFAVNSTAGIAGVFEIAEPTLGLPKARQDFGKTLAHWGFDSGPYIVLPILGPSSLRDSVGKGVDFLTDPVASVSHTPTTAVLQASRAVDSRSQLLFFDNMIMGDEYLFVREAYLQLRAEEVGEPGSLQVAFEEF